MTNIQQLGDLHMALHINRKLYEQGEITKEMYMCANEIFTERLLKLEQEQANVLHDTA